MSSLVYAAESQLRARLLAAIRKVAPSCAAVGLRQLPGPCRPQNWRIAVLDVLAEHFADARATANALEDARHWVMVPDGHPFAGQVFPFAGQVFGGTAPR